MHDRPMIKKLMWSLKFLVAVSALIVSHLTTIHTPSQPINFTLCDLMRLPEMLIEDLPLHIALPTKLTHKVDESAVLFHVFLKQAEDFEAFFAARFLTNVLRGLKMLQCHVLLEISIVAEHFMANLTLHLPGRHFFLNFMNFRWFQVSREILCVCHFLILCLMDISQVSNQPRRHIEGRIAASSIALIKSEILV